MILNESAVFSMAQEAANRSYRVHHIYQRHSGEYIFCMEGMFNTVREYILKPQEQVKYISAVLPEGMKEE